MKCEYCRERLWELSCAELPAEEAQQLRAHLAECPACAEEAKLVQSLSQTLRDLPEEELPSGFHDELMLKLSREKESRIEDTKEIFPSETEGKVVPFPKKRKPGRRNFGLIAAAVVLVAVLGGSQGILRMRSAQDAVVQEMTQQKNVDQVENESQTVQVDTAEAVPQETFVEEKTAVQPQTRSSSGTASTEKKAAEDSVQSAESSGNSSAGSETRTMNSEPVTQTTNTVTEGTGANEEELDIMPMTVSQPTDGQLGLRSAVPMREDVTLMVADVPAAMTQVEVIAQKMSLTEVEKTETSLTYAMMENQKPAFLEELKEVGSHESEVAATDSQNEILVKVNFEVQVSE